MLKLIPKHNKILIRSMSSTINQSELDKFSKMSSDWWNPNGVCKPLHSMNRLRVPLVRDGLIETGLVNVDQIKTDKPLKGLRILDVGCGAGILSEALARIGADVTGIDACQDNIEVAKLHAQKDNSLSSLRYICSSVEAHCDSEEKNYDAVVASEVIEHVDNQELFVSKCSSLVRESGSLFFTTLSKTQLSWLVAIVGAEYVLGLLPRGTHEWNKFITPEDLENLLKVSGCKSRLVSGMAYNPLTNSWSWEPTKFINYAIHAVKM